MSGVTVNKATRGVLGTLYYYFVAVHVASPAASVYCCSIPTGTYPEYRVGDRTYRLNPRGHVFRYL